MAKTKLLIEDTDHKYEISKEDILVYAKQIGIDINTEKHLIWIAEKGLSANVPKPWLILSDEKDRVFYYNVETKEKSWTHPLDKDYASLVSEERTKSKSWNSASSDYGFESKLSSLADAPPLSSSGRNSPPSARLGKHEGGLSKKIEFGRIENKRGTQLAPVRLNALKMPVPTAQKPSGGMSFMPKGATLVKRRLKEEAEYSPSHLEEEGHEYGPDDSNESLNSDEGSKYSYEESEDEEKNIRGLEPYDLIDPSQMSPVHSADESPDALDINSLVQFSTKLPPRFEDSKRRLLVENVNNKENSPSLSLRKAGQPSLLLKPLTQTTKKKNSFKGSNAAKKDFPKKNKYANESDLDFQHRLSAINEEQKLMLEQIQSEWLAMQDELEKQEKEKYEEMVKDGSKKLEEEEIKLRKENSEKISKIKEELQKNIEDQEREAQKHLQDLKISNQERIKEEEEKFKKELDALAESKKSEIKIMEEKYKKELAEKKNEFEESIKNESEKLKAHDSKKKSIEDAQLAEISNIQENHKKRIEEILKSLEKEENEAKIKLKEQESAKQNELEEEVHNLEKLIKDETEKYQNLLSDKDKLLKEITAERENLGKLKAETAEMQTSMQELQDEIEKNENDLDLLRSEKSALISELNVLKENINNEKENLLNLEKKLKSSDNVAKCSTEYAEVGVNTYSLCLDTNCKASQISVSCAEAFCQSEDIACPVSEVSCQTSVLLVTASKSCQVNIVPSTDEKNIPTNSNDDDKRKLNTNSAIDKNLEKALSGLGTKLDSRIGVIEHQLKLLQENLIKSSSNQATFPSQESAHNLLTEVTSVSNSDNRNIPPVYSTDSTVPIGLFTNNTASSLNKCKCELGDSASCSVMQDVKNSVYRINDILSHNFVPPVITPNVYQVNQVATNYTSPFENFYSQFREMQEKHRLTELKHKCENEVVKLTKSSSNTTDNNTAGNFTEKELTKPSYHFMHSNLYPHNVSDDPLIRARNIVLREQAKVWKQQQSLNTPVSYSFSQNIKPSLENYHSSYSGSNTSFHEIPASQQSFLNIAVDPETDYNTWMTRLNALQLRIRSHKLL